MCDAIAFFVTSSLSRLGREGRDCKREPVEDLVRLYQHFRRDIEFLSLQIMERLSLRLPERISDLHERAPNRSDNSDLDIFI